VGDEDHRQAELVLQFKVNRVTAWRIVA
jgi:hypothetical protein